MDETQIDVTKSKIKHVTQKGASSWHVAIVGNLASY
jgi:hypothetical protein